MRPKLRLGVNIDHVATIRNARGGEHPCPVRAAHLATQAGADGITAHLREDRRHISDQDIERLSREIKLPLNFEMAATDEMQNIALTSKPNACCLVPERREELTTEGGLDVASAKEKLRSFIHPLKAAKIRISMFVDPDEDQIQASHDIGADIVELHTGPYCENFSKRDNEATGKELYRLTKSANFAHSLGLEVHAGHGLGFDSVGPIAEIPELLELNIGHFLVGESIFIGFAEAIKLMRKEMDAAREET